MREDIKERIAMIERGEVPEGYKKSGNRIIPSDWNEEKIKDIAEVLTGGTPVRGIADFWNGHIPWVTTSLIDFNTIYTTEELITEEGLKNSAAKLLPRNTIVMAMYGQGITRGKVAVLGIQATTNQACCAMVVYSKYSHQYVFYYLMNEYYNIRKLSNDGSQRNLNTSLIKEFKLVIGSLVEQHRIASVISAWDRAIELKEKLLEHKRILKRGLIERLLTGKVRLPGFRGEWKKIKLSDIFDRVTRRNDTGSANVLTISAQKGLISQTDYFNKSVASETLDKYFLLRKGEFAYNKSYSNGYPMGAIKRLNDYREGVVTTLYICFKLKDDAHDSNFFEQYFAAGVLNKALMKITQEGARAHGLLNIAVSDFFAITVCIPQKLEQAAIAEIISQSDNVIRQLEREIAQLKLQKKGLMQLLLTGKVRVPC